jgi:ssDNA-binding replication factor A large subunit
MSFEKILEEILRKSKLSKDEILERIKRKQAELQIISLEGAAYLVAKELGILNLSSTERRLQMKNLVDGMKNIFLKGKILKISDLIEFEKNGKKGKVLNLFVSDGTDLVKIPLWNDQVDWVKKENLREGDVIEVLGGLVRENAFGEKEIILRKLGRIRKTEDDLRVSLEELKAKFLNTKPWRIKLRDATLGNYEIIATIVQVFKSKFVFPLCPACNVSVKQEGNKYLCKIHGEVKPNFILVIPCIIDDGTATLRAVLFREVAEKLLSLKAEELKDLETNAIYEIVKKNVLGKELIFVGRIRKNKFFNRLELLVNDIKHLNYIEESKKLAEKVENYG